jgi:phosphoribosylformylglycinamidine synthase
MTRALVLRAAGVNCERETLLALEQAGAVADLLHLQQVISAPSRLDEYSLLVFPGGFSYGDDIAAGRVLGFELRTFLGAALAGFVARGGYVQGVAARPSERTIALTANVSGHYECRWVTLRNERSACRWLDAGVLWPTPVAHGEGRLMFKDEATLKRLEERGQIALRYVTREGASASYPELPNGSTAAIAGLCDPSGRVFGLMPHPERNVTPWHHPRWTRTAPRPNGEGLEFYRRLVAAAGAVNA